MNDLKLGKLEQVEVREAWKHEAHDFTPWLAGNLGLLSEELQIELELEATEMPIDSYRVDIVARDRRDDSIVLIENQLETADLKHLGQILAYMTGLGAHTIVWVAADFKDIHRSAIRWLNEHTADPFAFFAVRVSAVRIGDSPLAPVFEVLERPNEWDRRVQTAGKRGELSEAAQFRLEFWEYFAQRIPDAPRLQQGYAASYVRHSVGQSNICIVQYVSSKEVGIYLLGAWGEPVADAAPRIEPYNEALRGCLDEGEDFYDSKNSLCAIQLPLDDSRDRANWGRMVDWLDDRRRRYEKILSAPPPKL